MNGSKKTVLVVSLCCVLGLLVPALFGQIVSSAGALPTAEAIVLGAVSPGAESSFAYVGSKKCKKCHIKEHKSWAKTKMGQAFEILKPGESEEAKKKFDLEINKDYTTDETCLKCHTVGFGKPGGYVVPDPTDKKAVRTAKKFQGIGCECCHGPGGEYVKVFEEIQKSKRTYKVEELYAVGLVKIDEATCLTCHNEESPTINAGDAFDYGKRKSEGAHENYPLKQRTQ